jgi:hypothetical protein
MKLVQFTKYNTFSSKIPPSASVHFATRVRTRRVARLYSVQYSEIALPRKPFGYTVLLRMTDTVTSQNIDLSSWDIVYTQLFTAVVSEN